jgi:hypothetical protein
MSNKTKGLHTLKGSSLEDYFQLICEDTLDDYFQLICEDTLDDYFQLICEDTLEDYFQLIYEVPIVVENKPKRVWNETEHWLYGVECKNYELVLNLVQKKTPYNNRFTLPQDQIVSYFHEFLTEQLIKNNQLKKELDRGKKVKSSVVYEWYLQYVVREKYKEGKDCHQRSRGARTQSEVTKIKAYELEEVDTPYAPSHQIKNLESQGFQVAQRVSKMDAETGQQIGEPDLYVHNDEFLSIEERSENEYMKDLLLNRFGSKQLDIYYELWLELRYAEYENKKNWAKSRKVSYKVLTSRINQIKDVFKDNLEAFGY